MITQGDDLIQNLDVDAIVGPLTVCRMSDKSPAIAKNVTFTYALTGNLLEIDGKPLQLSTEGRSIHWVDIKTKYKYECSFISFLLFGVLFAQVKDAVEQTLAPDEVSITQDGDPIENLFEGQIIGPLAVCKIAPTIKWYLQEITRMKGIQKKRYRREGIISHQAHPCLSFCSQVRPISTMYATPNSSVKISGFLLKSNQMRCTASFAGRRSTGICSKHD